jgi:hypothetical protein
MDREKSGSPAFYPFSRITNEKIGTRKSGFRTFRPGGAALLLLHPPREEKFGVRILPGYETRNTLTCIADESPCEWKILLVLTLCLYVDISLKL